MEKNKKSNLDELDRKILAILMKNAKTPYAEIGKQLFVSAGTIHVRMKKMEKMGIIKGQVLLVEPVKLGFDICAFLGIYLERNSLYDEVASLIEQIPEVVEAHYTTGIYSIFVKIICKDTRHLRSVLHDKIQRIPGIQRTETFISLEESINRAISLS